MPIGEAVSEFFEFLHKELRVGVKCVIHTDQIMVHPKNRGGLMINGFDSQTKGSKVKHVGANLAKLTDAVCIELSPDPAKRKDVGAPLYHRKYTIKSFLF